MFKRAHPEYYLQNDGFHSYNTKHKNKIAVVAHKSSFMEKSPHFQTAKIYGLLPNRLRNIENHIIFKNQLKTILLSKKYYSVKHFFSHKISENDDAFYTKIVK
jgi:hypothetical protein